MDLGHLQSTYVLAQFYHYGLGGVMDKPRAQELFGAAAARGHERAASFLTNPMIKAVLAKLTAANVELELVERANAVLDSLELVFFNLRQEHLVNDKRDLAHFTTWNAIDKILPSTLPVENENCLRQYHVDYMNDPFEGQRLLTFVSKASEKGPRDTRAEKTSALLRSLFDDHYFSSFNSHNSTEDLLPSVFTVSLTEQSDRLDLWRAYGADGKGYAIVIPFEGNQGDEFLLHRNRDTSLKFSDETYDDKVGVNSDNSRPLLYWIRYTDDEVVAALVKLAKPLANLHALEDEIEDPHLWACVASCATAILLELLYLFKDEQYSTEREARALSVMHLDNVKIKVDERTPGHLYCETAPFLFRSPGYEVILGPKVEKPAAALWNIRHKLTFHGMAANAVVRKSKVPYR
jgi:hypothetical protein